jgi:phospholipid/cholesterol/gamma-HCH transport system permease protein
MQITPRGRRARRHLSGAWDIRALESRVPALQQALRDAGATNAALWDLSQIQRFDHIGAMLVWRAWGRCRPMKVQLRSEHEIFFGACEGSLVASASQPAARDPFWPAVGLGRGVLDTAEHALEMVTLFGQLLIDAVAVARQPLLRPWREFSASIYSIGAQALGITALVGFLIGVVLSYLSAGAVRAWSAPTFSSSTSSASGSSASSARSCRYWSRGRRDRDHGPARGHAGHRGAGTRFR